MRDRIVDILRGRFGDRLLLAVESGSRAWDLHSEDSDWDVRGIYHRPAEDYVTVSQSPDETVEFEDGKIDFQLWDASKACRLLGQNAKLKEWTESPTVYAWSPWAGRLKGVVCDYWNPRSYVYHYRGLAKKNYRRYVDGEDRPERKKYLYAVRALCQALRFVRAGGEFVHTCFDAEEVFKEVDHSLYANLQELTSRKRSGENMGKRPRDQELNDWIEEQLDSLMERCNELPAQSVPHDTKDELLHAAVGLDD